MTDPTTPVDLDRLDAAWQNLARSQGDASVLMQGYPFLSAELRALREKLGGPTCPDCGQPAVKDVGGFPWSCDGCHWAGEPVTFLEFRVKSGDEASEVMDAQGAELRALRAEVERIEKRPWEVLLEILNKVYPADIFPTTHKTDESDRDPGPRIVALIRWVDELRAENERLRADASGVVCDELREVLRVPQMQSIIDAAKVLMAENERLRAVRDAAEAMRSSGFTVYGDVMQLLTYRFDALAAALDAAAGGA